MVDPDLERAKRLLKSAKDLHEQGDLSGVAGLAYAAFESAAISLAGKINGKDPGNHTKRRERVKKELNKYQDKIDLLWDVRNVDFYGNEKIGYPKREITEKEVGEGLNAVEKIIEEIEKIVK